MPYNSGARSSSPTPLNELVYAEHPYFHNVGDQMPVSWGNRFGNCAATAPVVSTEWAPVSNASVSSSIYYCNASTSTDTLALFQDLRTRGIGITNYAYDFSWNPFGSALYGLPPTATSFANNAQWRRRVRCRKVIESWYPSNVIPTRCSESERCRYSLKPK